MHVVIYRRVCVRMCASRPYMLMICVYVSSSTFILMLITFACVCQSLFKMVMCAYECRSPYIPSPEDAERNEETASSLRFTPITPTMRPQLSVPIYTWIRHGKRKNKLLLEKLKKRRKKRKQKKEKNLGFSNYPGSFVKEVSLRINHASLTSKCGIHMVCITHMWHTV